jgi:hypothetical protein
VLLSDNLDQDTLPAPAVETRVPAIPAGPKDLLPRAKVQSPVGDCHDDLAAHHAQLGELRSVSGGRRRYPRRCSCDGSGRSARGALGVAFYARPPGHWGLRAIPKEKAEGFLPSACRPRSSSLMNTLVVICGSRIHCMAFTRDNAFYHTCRFRSLDARDDCKPGARSAELR